MTIRKGNPNWKKGGQSPNPSGRPPGIADKRLAVSELLKSNAGGIIDVVIKAAKSGDMQACALVLNRIAPALKPQAEPVKFELDVTMPIVQQCEQVLSGVAKGEVPADVAKGLIEMIASVAAIKQVVDIEQRLTLLEQR